MAGRQWHHRFEAGNQLLRFSRGTALWLLTVLRTDLSLAEWRLGMESTYYYIGGCKLEELLAGYRRQGTDPASPHTHIP